MMQTVWTKIWLSPVIAFFICGCSPEDTQTDASETADFIITNARIQTVDENDSWAEALAVRDGVLIAVGSDADVMQFRGPDTAVEDLSGRMVMPGIHDTHNHPSDAGTNTLFECSFLSTDLAEVRQVLADCLAEIPEGEWLRGGQWNEALFPQGVLPKDILDEIAPNNPVFLMDWSVHNAWVNSMALALLGVDDDTPDPSGGVIVRDPDTGAATGILLDNAAYNYRREMPAYSTAQRSQALRWSMDTLARNGVTTFKEALTTTDFMQAYLQLAADDELSLRAKTNLTWKSAWANSHQEELDLIENRSEFAAASVDARFAKIMLDGIPPTYTAALLEPYAPNDVHGPDYRGKLMHDPEQLAADVTLLDAQGISVKIHATGDRSLRVALDAFEAARNANGDTGIIHEVSHAEMIHPDDLSRFRELNVAAEMCPILWYPIAGLEWAQWVGEERAKVWPIKSLLESGALVTYGSDWPVVPSPNPWPGIEAMVTRADPLSNGEIKDWAEQAIDLADAIRIFTINGAVANRVGESSGSLEVGKDADYIVLNQNIFDVPITSVSDTVVEQTVVAGQTVFRN